MKQPQPAPVESLRERADIVEKSGKLEYINVLLLLPSITLDGGPIPYKCWIRVKLGGVCPSGQIYANLGAAVVG